MGNKRNGKKTVSYLKPVEKDCFKLKGMVFYFCLFVFTAIAVFDVFHDLSFSGTIIEWDEARHGVNAYEMLQSGNYIVNTYQYLPDYWNVKPPLSLWQVMFAYKLFGYNTFALRFFSALYLPVIVVTAMLVLKKYIGSICAIVTGFLFAMTGSRFYHLFKSGDPDALFFFLCYLSCVFLYVAYKEKPYYFIGTGICIALAFLTKGMHVIILFSVITICLALGHKKHRFSTKQLTIYLFLPMAMPVIIWAALRARYDGILFFEKMFILDVLNRVTSVVENHAGGPTFYIKVLFRVLGGSIFGGIVLLFLFCLLIKLTQERAIETEHIFLVIFGTMALAPFVIFTISATKLGWYVFPCVIGIYFIAGYSAQQIATRYDIKKGIGGIVYLSISFIILIVGGYVKPYKGNINLLTTNVTSSNSPFSQISITPGTKFFVVNSTGNADSLLNSWQLQAYYSGLEYVPSGMEQYADVFNEVIILKHSNYEQLESFR
jgi:4-amino-4-deoxy-L-arabinose transferase-like glycosyltransferase